MCSEFGLEWNNEGILGNKVEPGAESLTGPALVDYVNKKQNLWKVNLQRLKTMHHPLILFVVDGMLKIEY